MENRYIYLSHHFLGVVGVLFIEIWQILNEWNFFDLVVENVVFVEEDQELLAFERFVGCCLLKQVQHLVVASHIVVLVQHLE